MTDEPRSEEQATDETATATEQPEAATAEETAAEEEKKKLNQAVEIRDVGPCKKHIKVTIERDDIDRMLDEKYSELVVDANVAGFRPGKAPRKIIERRFRKEVVEQVRGELLLTSLEQLAEDHDLAPLAPPDIDPTAVEVPESGPMIYEFEVEVRPEFTLPNYTGLKIRRPVKTFTDEDVEREKRRLLSRYGSLVPKEGDKPTVEVGDFITADLSTQQADGEMVKVAREALLRVDKQLAFKDGIAERFGEQVQGASAGESREIEITLSDTVANPALRGHKVKAVLEVQDIKTLRLPELTHELLHVFGVHTPEQFDELVRVILERRLEYHQRQAAREQVLAQIAEASQWELPRDLLLRQARRALNRRVMEMRSAGISEEEIAAQQRLLQQDVVESTARALKEHFVLQKIAEVEKLDVDEDDIDNEIERMANLNNESPRRLRARLEKEDLLDALATELVERKALDLVLQSAEYEDVPLDATDEGAVATVEQQAVPGEMRDPTAVAEEEAAAQGAAEEPTESKE